MRLLHTSDWHIGRTFHGHSTLEALGGVLGLLCRAPQAFLQAGTPDAGGLDADAIEAKIAERAAAKKAKNFADADRIRAELTAAGVILEDGAGGTTWRRA